MIRAFRRDFGRVRINRKRIGRFITVEILESEFVNAVFRQRLTAFIRHVFAVFRKVYNRLIRPLERYRRVGKSAVLYARKQAFGQFLLIRKFCCDCVDTRSKFVRYDDLIFRRLSKRIRKRIRRDCRSVIVLFKQYPGSTVIR